MVLGGVIAQKKGARTCRAFLLMCLLSTLVASKPLLSFPVNSQVPPVARVDANYEFEVSEGTFSTTTSFPVTYSINDAPPWLEVDNSTRTLHGKPTLNDFGPFTFDLCASDPDGTSKNPVTLIVTQSEAPGTKEDVSDQLSIYGSVPKLNTIGFAPSSAFRFKLDPSTFRFQGKPFYYATLADRSPLPSWIGFDPFTMAFQGTTPPLNGGDKNIDMRLSASMIRGFEEASVLFTLEVSSHQLVFQNMQQNVRVEPGERLTLGNLRDDLSVDGNKLDSEQLQSFRTIFPDWLQVDGELRVSGVVPKNFATPQTLLVTATDVYGDEANAYINLLQSGRTGHMSTPKKPVSPTDNMTVTTSGPTISQSSQHATKGTAHDDTTKRAAIATPIAVLLFLVLSIGLVCLLRRRKKLEKRRQKNHASQEQDSRPMKASSKLSFFRHRNRDGAAAKYDPERDGLRPTEKGQLAPRTDKSIITGAPTQPRPSGDTVLSNSDGALVSCFLPTESIHSPNSARRIRFSNEIDPSPPPNRLGITNIPSPRMMSLRDSQDSNEQQDGQIVETIPDPSEPEQDSDLVGSPGNASLTVSIKKRDSAPRRARTGSKESCQTLAESIDFIDKRQDFIRMRGASVTAQPFFGARESSQSTPKKLSSLQLDERMRAPHLLTHSRGGSREVDAESKASRSSNRIFSSPSRLAGRFSIPSSRSHYSSVISEGVEAECTEGQGTDDREAAAAAGEHEKTTAEVPSCAPKDSNKNEDGTDAGSVGRDVFSTPESIDLEEWSVGSSIPSLGPSREVDSSPRFL